MKPAKSSRKARRVSGKGAEFDKQVLEYALDCWRIARDSLPEGCLPSVEFGAADNEVNFLSVRARAHGRTIIGTGDTFEAALKDAVKQADPATEVRSLRAYADELEKGRRPFPRY